MPKCLQPKLSVRPLTIGIGLGLSKLKRYGDIIRYSCCLSLNYTKINIHAYCTWSKCLLYDMLLFGMFRRIFGHGVGKSRPVGLPSQACRSLQGLQEAYGKFTEEAETLARATRLMLTLKD